MKKEILEINNLFVDSFYNYKLEKGVEITSNVDKSVVLIGSAISVLKEKLLNNNIDIVGNVISQRAIRTRSMKKLMIPEMLEWSSYFDALGVLVNYSNLEQLIFDSLNFLKHALETNYSNLVLKISSRDIDMINAIKKLGLGVVIELDSMQPDYYNHKYGLDNLGIYGRSFNIAYKKDKSLYNSSDLGNIIVIENAKKKYGVEFAVGANAIIMRKKGIITSIEASSISDLIDLKSPELFKFADCVSVISHLAKENVEKYKNDRSKIYIYHKYLRALEYWVKVLNISDSNILDLIEKYIILEYNDYNNEIINYNLKLLKKRR